MTNDIRNSLKQFALSRIDSYIGALMEANCRKVTDTPNETDTSKDLADCKAVRRGSIRVVEDDPFGSLRETVRVAFETAGKQGLFGHYGSRSLSILFRQDGSFVKAELMQTGKSLIPGGDGAIMACDSGSALVDSPTGDAMSLDASGEAHGIDGTSRRGTDAQETVHDVADAGVDTADAQADIVEETVPDAVEVAEDSTEVGDAAAEVDAGVEDTAETTPDAVDATADMTDAVELPDDIVEADATPEIAPETTPDITTGPEAICQYFCDTGITEVDAGLPVDATPTEDTAATYVTSKMCMNPVSGPMNLTAPASSVAAACTNSEINALIQGAKGCVAECGFYDNNVFLSTDSSKPVDFALSLFAPPQPPMQPYTITLSLQPPVFSNGSKPGLPGFLGSSFVFAFNQKLYNDVGDIVWDAKDNDSSGNQKGTVRILYQPKDFFFNLPAFLDITYTDSSGSKVSYRYPCDMLQGVQGKPNSIINCAEVK